MIDAETLKVQISVLRDAQRVHQAALQDAEQLEVAALAAEQHARDEAEVARRIQAQHRAAIWDCAADINEILELLRAIPGPRQP